MAHQYRNTHPDGHCVCQDDKHTVNVGEPDLPVAAVEQGKQVSDHDFTKFSITPSVTRKSGHSGQ